MIESRHPHPGVLLITLARPARRNAIDLDGFRALARAWHEFDSSDARVAVVTGDGGDLSSGADLASLGREVAEAQRLGAGSEAWRAIRTAVLRDFQPCKPVISAIEGICFGAGMEMVGATDIRIAGRSARFALPEVRWGLAPTGGSLARLARQVPYAAAMQILLTGEEHPAPRLGDWGFVNEVVEDGHALDRALELAEAITRNSPVATRTIKSAVINGVRGTLDQAHALELEVGQVLADGQDAREGVAAFQERRQPSWRL
jgi:enoyl-CoA hydratase